MKRIIKKTRFRWHMCSSCVGGGSNLDAVSGPLLPKHAFPLMSPRNSPTRWPGFHVWLSCCWAVWPLACCLLKTQCVTSWVLWGRFHHVHHCALLVSLLGSLSCPLAASILPPGWSSLASHMTFICVYFHLGLDRSKSLTFFTVTFSSDFFLVPSSLCIVLLLISYISISISTHIFLHTRDNTLFVFGNLLF